MYLCIVRKHCVCICMYVLHVCVVYARVLWVHGVSVSNFLLYAVGRGRLRINKIENVGKALTFLTQEKKVCC